MKANEKTVLRFLESLDTKFTIPVYQRRYSWNIDECKRLFDDLIAIDDKELNVHFFGSMVTIYNENSSDREYLIIDGQQRITSISLLLLAIYNIATNGLRNTNVNVDMIMNEYLINKYKSYNDRLKLKLTYEDQESYKAIFDSIELHDITRVSINYSYFYNRILKNEINIDKLFESIKKLSLIDIELKISDDNPQLIFESLNSTAKSLTEADKIRNLIFLGEDNNTQEELYLKYLLCIEKSIGIDITDFIKVYLAIKKSKVINNDKIYEEFKEFFYKTNITSRELLEDMKIYANIYSKVNKKHINNEFEDILKRVRLLGIKQSLPFIVELLNFYKKGIITKAKALETLEILESYIFRRGICSLPTNATNKFFVRLFKNIKEYDKWQDDYLEIFKFILLSQVDTLRFPRDLEFKKEFFSKELYRGKREFLIYTLERLENFDNKERIDIHKLIEAGDLTIEHIIPQKLNSKWIQDLGVSYKEIINKYAHTIGNLTLTGYNSSMGNKSFLEKRDIKRGFRQSRLKLNKYLSVKEKFTEKEVIERLLLLFDDAKKIWKSINTRYKYTKPRKLLYYLSDDIDIDNRKIEDFAFEGILYSAKNFKEVFDKVLNILYDIEPLVLKLLSKNSLKIDFMAFKISDVEEFLMNSYEVVEGVYADGKLSNYSRINILKNIFQLYNIDLDELSFYIFM